MIYFHRCFPPLLLKSTSVFPSHSALPACQWFFFFYSRADDKYSSACKLALLIRESGINTHILVETRALQVVMELEHPLPWGAGNARLKGSRFGAILKRQISGQLNGCCCFLKKTSSCNMPLPLILQKCNHFICIKVYIRINHWVFVELGHVSSPCLQNPP